jgi:hypothetical protein
MSRLPSPRRVVGALATLALGVLLAASCGRPSFDPPASPAHDEEEEGVMHGRRYKTPFLCGDPSRPDDPKRTAPCPSVRPPDAQLSCDAIGCHGGYDFTNPSAARHLRGSEGPSCYTCHGEEWKDD